MGRNTPIDVAAEFGWPNVIEILAPLMGSDFDATWAIYTASKYGYTEIVRQLVCFAINPNLYLAIGVAASEGHSDIIKILEHLLTDNPNISEVRNGNLNTPDENGITPIFEASRNGLIDVVKKLAPLVSNPNAPEKTGRTPIYMAAQNGHTEIVKILAPLTDNPNAPNKWGQTPIKVAKNAEIRRILKSYKTST